MKRTPKPIDGEYARLSLKELDLDLVLGEASRRSLKRFLAHFWPIVEPGYRFLDNWHLDCLCDHLANAFEIKNLIINIPPRCSKTLLIGVFWPAWLWIHKPSLRFMFTSYGLDLSRDASVKCRELIQCDLYQKLYGSIYQLKDDSNTKERFDNNKKGYRLATSVGGITTGFGADALICDDPHNVKKAESEVERENVIRWFQNSFFNRLNDPTNGCRLVVGQRVHRNDLSGYLQENFKEDWTTVTLPYEHKHSGPVSIGWPKLGHLDPRTTEGQALWPERFPESELRTYKRNWATFETQYNQNPVETDNVLFKPENFRYFDETDTHYKSETKQIEKAKCYRVVSSDLAISQSAKADYTVIMVADIAPTGEIIILHVQRERMGGTRIVPALSAINDAWQPAYLLIEDVAFQRIILEQARLEGLPVRGIRPDTDKESRTIPLQVRFEGRQIWFPKDKPFMEKLERELLQGFNGTHDDQIDAIAYLAIEANRRCRGRKEVEAPKPAKSEAELYNAALWAGID